MKNFTCQVDIQDKAILNRASMNVMTTREKSQERLFEKNLCVLGQKVDDDLTINGNTVGVMT